jgi:hypothetical protein
LGENIGFEMLYYVNTAGKGIDRNSFERLRESFPIESCPPYAATAAATAASISSSTSDACKKFSVVCVYVCVVD